MNKFSTDSKTEPDEIHSYEINSDESLLGIPPLLDRE